MQKKHPIFDSQSPYNRLRACVAREQKWIGYLGIHVATSLLMRENYHWKGNCLLLGSSSVIENHSYTTDLDKTGNVFTIECTMQMPDTQCRLMMYVPHELQTAQMIEGWPSSSSILEEVVRVLKPPAMQTLDIASSLLAQWPDVEGVLQDGTVRFTINHFGYEGLPVNAYFFLLVDAMINE